MQELEYSGLPTDRPVRVGENILEASGGVQRFFLPGRGEIMRRITCVVLLLTAASLMSAQETDSDQEHAKWIASVMDSIQTVKPGMTRNDLLRVFTIEGGLSNRLHRTYVYKRCPYIKVAVEFEAVGNPEDILTEMPADKIEKISTPFLQYSVMD